jgi:16S rRNA (uracil1498-N3)-methyltransferase
VGGFAAHVFVDDLGADSGSAALPLADEDVHHLFRVRRLRPGERVSAGDGRGRWRPCVVEGSGARQSGSRAAAAGGALVLAPVGPVVAEPRPEPPITVGFALVKGERPESVIQKLTESGVDRIIPVVTERTVVRWSGTEVARPGAKWERVAREAGMQCRRAWLPVVSPVTNFDDVVAQHSSGGLALATTDGEPPSLAWPAVLIGPEGGWSAAELRAPLRRVAFGELVYRSETAAAAAAAILNALRGHLVAETRERAYPESRRHFGG